MKFRKQILFILFSIILSLSVFSNILKTYAETETAPVFGTLEEGIQSNSGHFIVKESSDNTKNPLNRNGSVGWEEWKLTSTKVLNSNYRFGWHPDSYYFSSTKKTTFTLSIAGGYGAFAVSVGAPSSPSSGYIINATSTKKSRPAVYGELKVYNGAGLQTSSRTERLYRY
ncbi:hypothetical protein [Gottfriedia luciferensis]|uniref:hypothetical protein n=1 Tax=Gottfriedia luciferensis TaxID=178774 RepID=UPI000B4310C1|nr:hypothetical protein [Gottfriedia luciferensis]